MTATATRSYAVDLAWTDNNGGSVYQISNGSVSLFTHGAATGFEWSGLRPGTRMCFTVRALSSGASPWAPASAAAACATTPALTCQATQQTPDDNDDIDFYHGTSLTGAENIEGSGVNLNYGDRYVDFGKGFYATTDLAQAEDWAKQNYANDSPSVVHFTVKISELEPGGPLCGAVLTGPYGYTSQFLPFVTAMRTFEPSIGGAGYDFVEGPLLDNPFGYIAGFEPPGIFGEQDSFHTAAGAKVLDAGMDPDIITVP